ncbi:MAG: hypothetical protein AB7I41_11230 [Candidatus Sericytochromatia bacterium]
MTELMNFEDIPSAWIQVIQNEILPLLEQGEMQLAWGIFSNFYAQLEKFETEFKFMLF